MSPGAYFRNFTVPVTTSDSLSLFHAFLFQNMANQETRLSKNIARIVMYVVSDFYGVDIKTKIVTANGNK